jgi:hypothetical protein
MRKCSITVYDYDDALHGRNFSKSLLENPSKYEVEAWCVGGDEGIKAFFFVDDKLCMADGDDGHWWLVDVCHKGWLKEIREAINAIEEDKAP